MRQKLRFRVLSQKTQILMAALIVEVMVFLCAVVVV